MITYEDNIVILLRKILALLSPDSFNASEDIEREILLEKISSCDIFLYDVLLDFVDEMDALMSRIFAIETNKKASSNNKILNIIKILEVECKSKHINIEYELNQLLSNGNIIEE